jgi:hypothetical protein
VIVPIPKGRLLDETEWDDYLREQIPALSKLYNEGKFDQIETYKALAGLTWNQYWDAFLAPYTSIPVMRNVMLKLLSSSLVGVQPMTEFAGEVFNFKTKRSK